MDDRRFDSLVKALAEGSSRRSLLKGLLGLGGVAVAGSSLRESNVEAARRPTPTPKPPTCPGKQTPQGGQCVCIAPPAPGTQKCGPDCCNPTGVGPLHSECCDNACCYGHCFGEELCCPTDNYCPGANRAQDLCCPDGERCCGAGASGNVCVDLAAGQCCSTGDCGSPGPGECARECVAGLCVPVVCSEGQICCEGACVSSQSFVACPSDPAGCCDLSAGENCCGAGGCCPGNLCNEIGGVCCEPGERACGTGENACCEPPLQCCGSGSASVCCQPGFCLGGNVCCSGGEIPCGSACCLSGQCNQESYQCCPPGTTPCVNGCCAPDPCEGVVCGSCEHCDAGLCADNLDFTACDSGYCRNGICHPCIADTTVEPLFSCSFDVECCSGCCLGESFESACQTQFEGFPDLLEACENLLAPFVGGLYCVQNPLPIPGFDASVELPCQSV